MVEPLSDGGATPITAVVAATHAEFTRTVFSGTLAYVGTLVYGPRDPTLPAARAAVCACPTERAGQDVSFSTIDQACSAIGHHYRHQGHPDPITHGAVHRVRRGLRRTLGTVRVARHARSAGSGRIAEMRRVLRPGGLLVLAGHVASINRVALDVHKLLEVISLPAHRPARLGAPSRW